MRRLRTQAGRSRHHRREEYGRVVRKWSIASQHNNNDNNERTHFCLLGARHRDRDTTFHRSALGARRHRGDGGARSQLRAFAHSGALVHHEHSQRVTKRVEDGVDEYTETNGEGDKVKVTKPHYSDIEARLFSVWNLSLLSRRRERRIATAQLNLPGKPPPPSSPPRRACSRRPPPRLEPAPAACLGDRPLPRSVAWRAPQVELYYHQGCVAIGSTDSSNEWSAGFTPSLNYRDGHGEAIKPRTGEIARFANEATRRASSSRRAAVVKRPPLS